MHCIWQIKYMSFPGVNGLHGLEGVNGPGSGHECSSLSHLVSVLSLLVGCLSVSLICLPIRCLGGLLSLKLTIKGYIIILGTSHRVVKVSMGVSLAYHW